MRGAASALPAAIMALALGACEREPSFDDRYDSAQKTIEAKARELDAQIARDEAAQSEAVIEEELAPEPTAPQD